MATYTLKGTRYIRRYDAPVRTPVYSAASDAAQIAADICNCPWVEIGTAASVFPSHNDKALDANLETRDLFDAANFCTDHQNGMHLAHANVACYKFALPPGASGLTLTSLTARISCDPYCRDGARVAVNTNDSGVIPTACEDCRVGLAHAARVAPRTVSADGSTWYGATADAVITPSSPITLGSYLYVFVTLETPSYSRDAWLEGAAKAVNSFEVTLSTYINGIEDGSTIDCSRESREYNVCRDGVLPELPPGARPVLALALQATGDDIPHALHHDVADESGVKVYRDGVLEDLIGGLPAGSVKNVCLPMSQWVPESIGTTLSYTCVCGTFAGGSIPGIDGLYIYDNISHELVTVGDYEAMATYVAPLQALSREHGGIYAAYIVPNNFTPADQSAGCLVDLVVVASDGSYINTNIPGTATNTALRVALNAAITGHGVMNIRAPNGSIATVARSDSVKVAHLLFYALNPSTSSTSVTFTVTKTFPVCLNSDGSVTLGSSTYSPTGGTVRALVNSGNGKFIAIGDFTKLGSTTCTTGACVFTPTFTVSRTSYPATLTVSWAAASLSDWKKPNGWGGFCAGGSYTTGTSNPSVVMFGGFTQAGGTSAPGVAIWSNGNLTSPQWLRSVASRIPRPSAVAVLPGGEMIVASAESSDDGTDLPSADRVHTSVTAEQSCIGLRTLYARHYLGQMTRLTSGGVARPGASFVVRRGSVTVETSDGDITCPAWMADMSALVVPFACPTDYAASRIRIDWSDIDATIGSTIRVWLKRGAYLDSYPDISHPDIWQSDTADGWEHVGTIAADTDATSATFEIEPLRCRVATLMITAFVSMDHVNPDDDTTSPQGVGTLAVNPITGAITGSGIIPDITLIG